MGSPVATSHTLGEGQRPCMEPMFQQDHESPQEHDSDLGIMNMKNSSWFSSNMHRIALLCIVRIGIVHVQMHQTHRIVLSKLPDTTRLPSKLKATHVTVSACPCSAILSSMTMSHNLQRQRLHVCKAWNIWELWPYVASQGTS